MYQLTILLDDEEEVVVIAEEEGEEGLEAVAAAACSRRCIVDVIWSSAHCLACYASQSCSGVDGLKEKSIIYPRIEFR